MIDTCFGIAGLIIALIVFAELYSIRNILSNREKMRDDRQELSNEIRSLKWNLSEQSEAITDLIEIIEEAKVPLSATEKASVNHAKYLAKVNNPKIIH